MPHTDDRPLTCRDCGAAFTFSADERQAFASQGHSNPPSRCATCRAARKQRQTESGTRIVGPRFRERRDVHTSVVCSDCGAPAVVPFAAPADRAVYCPGCFRRRRAGGTA